MASTLTPVINPEEPVSGDAVVALRPEFDARHNTSLVGMVIFLGSWAVMFAALFFAFSLYRVRTDAWPPASLAAVPGWMPWASTLLILLSSATLERGRRRLAGPRGAQLLLGSLIQTLLLAAGFLAVQSALWHAVWTDGIEIDADQFSGHFYLLTIFHGLHVVVGLGLLSSLVARARRGASPSLAIHAMSIGLFWHFVGVAWALIFVLLFVL